jgi:hypothetical protein
MKDDLFGNRPKGESDFEQMKDAGVSGSGEASKEGYLKDAGLGSKELENGFSKEKDGQSDLLYSIMRFPFGRF